MERLWAPWRLSYIKGEPPEGCIFCAQAAEDGDDDDSLIVFRGERCYVVLNLYPYGSGHLMILPYRHVGTPGGLDAEERSELWELLDRALRALSDGLGAHGHNVGLNLGTAAGAGIEDHLHLHVVPRWRGDVNFMPVLADLRVMPQHLAETRAALIAAWPA
jgi:ATP adenylyltransferase